MGEEDYHEFILTDKPQHKLVTVADTVLELDGLLELACGTKFMGCCIVLYHIVYWLTVTAHLCTFIYL